MEMFKKKYEEPWAEIEYFTICDIMTKSSSYGDGGDDEEDPFGDGTNSVIDPTF